MNLLTQVLSIISKGVIGGGSLMAVWYGIGLGRAVKEHQGPEIQNNLMGLAGAAIIIAAGALITAVTFS